MFNENVKSFRLRERTKWPGKRVTEMAAGQEDRRGAIDESIIIDRSPSKLTWIDNTCYQAICIRFIIIIASWIYDTIYCHLQGGMNKKMWFLYNSYLLHIIFTIDRFGGKKIIEDRGVEFSSLFFFRYRHISKINFSE